MGLALDLEDYYPSVLLHCWLGRLTCKIVSEMTYNVSNGTLNPTIPYHTHLLLCLLVSITFPFLTRFIYFLAFPSLHSVWVIKSGRLQVKGIDLYSA